MKKLAQKFTHYVDHNYPRATKIEILCPGISLIQVSQMTKYPESYGHTEVYIQFGDYKIQDDNSWLHLKYELETDKIIDGGWSDYDDDAYHDYYYDEED